MHIRRPYTRHANMDACSLNLTGISPRLCLFSSHQITTDCCVRKEFAPCMHVTSCTDIPAFCTLSPDVLSALVSSSAFTPLAQSSATACPHTCIPTYMHRYAMSWPRISGGSTFPSLSSLASGGERGSMVKAWNERPSAAGKAAAGLRE